MAPDKRREQILDSAVALIIDRGLSSCTLEAVSVQARISKPLIYKYFLRLEDLFKALVEREYRYLRGRGLNVLPLECAISKRSSVARICAPWSICMSAARSCACWPAIVPLPVW